VAELEEERVRLETPAAVPAGGVTLESLRPVMEGRVVEMRGAFEGSPERRRGAFRALLGPGGRMRVLPDPSGASG
jgi:hypothetical protein